MGNHFCCYSFEPADHWTEFFSQQPDIDGIDTFAGPACHSALWDHDIDLTGKRVALIGAGASEFQIAPAIADHYWDWTRSPDSDDLRIT
ncbi:MAG: hypothetical protein OSA99_06980 [Acidimicrobiales bacterium]|nr:hypothetical protein [Acidimicrobiales bacterium]